ncbi:MAG TPA: indole-3-glycerol-phosphate synthase, partial [Spirochaetes bacterium]|nr:indole-3-glycerol-phosphate synthase [Spirochaetota bacterium]
MDRMRERKESDIPSLEKTLKLMPERRRARHLLSTPADGGIGIIAEVKKASPSRRDVRAVEPSRQACLYREGGALGVSVLTDGAFFAGSWDDLEAAAAVVDAPVLCKEFVYFEEQIDMADRLGADLVLLIARTLSDKELRRLYRHALDRSITPLVEVHRPAELARALSLDPEFLMVNMRDLGTLALEFRTGIETLRAIPEGILKISASGVAGRDDIVRIHDKTGATVFLVGSALM